MTKKQKLKERKSYREYITIADKRVLDTKKIRYRTDCRL